MHRSSLAFIVHCFDARAKEWMLHQQIAKWREELQAPRKLQRVLKQKTCTKRACTGRARTESCHGSTLKVRCSNKSARNKLASIQRTNANFQKSLLGVWTACFFRKRGSERSDCAFVLCWIKRLISACAGETILRRRRSSRGEKHGGRRQQPSERSQCKLVAPSCYWWWKRTEVGKLWGLPNGTWHVIIACCWHSWRCTFRGLVVCTAEW